MHIVGYYRYKQLPLFLLPWFTPQQDIYGPKSYVIKRAS